MSGDVSFWAVVGLATGALHAVSLWRSSRRPASIEGALGLVRVLSVGAMLFLAARSEGLLPAAVGWGVGLPSAGCALFFGSRR